MNKEIEQELLNYYTEDWHNDEKMISWEMKNVSDAYKLSNGRIYVFKKPIIEKDFCYGYSDSAIDTKDYDRANNLAYKAQNDENVFRGENLRQFDEKKILFR